MSQGVWVGIVTAVVMLAFLAASIWALLPAQKQRFAEAAQLPLEDLPLQDLRQEPSPAQAQRAAEKEGRA